MPNDPTNLMDPSHPFHEQGAQFAAMLQQRQARDAKQQMLAQVLATPAATGGAMAPWQTPPPASSSGLAGAGSGLSGLAQMLAAQQVNSSKFGPGPDSSNNWRAANGGMKAPAALPADSVALGGMAKG